VITNAGIVQNGPLCKGKISNVKSNYALTTANSLSYCYHLY